MEQEELVSEVWQLSGVIGSVVPGILTWVNERVAFVTPQGKQFDVLLSEIKEVKYPFLRMGMGFDAVINGKKYKFSFSKPNPSAPELDDESGDQLLRSTHVGRAFDSYKTLRNIRSDKATTQQWKKILNG